MTVKGDRLDEVDEVFHVNLSGATNASIDDGQGAETIFDNDGFKASAEILNARLA